MRNVLTIIFPIFVLLSCKKDSPAIYDSDNNSNTENKLLEHLSVENVNISGNYYYENNKSYKIEYKSDYDSIKIEQIQNTRAIKFKVNPDTDYNNERAEIRIAEMVPFIEGMKWVSINYYATNPVQGIIFQCHQFPPNNPPIAIRSKSNGKLVLEIFNDSNAQTGTPITHEIGQAVLNEWQNVIIGFQIDEQNNGKIWVYLNQSATPDLIYNGKIGFSFEQQFFDTIKFGIYRGRGKQTTDILYADEIKYGTSLESVK